MNNIYEKSEMATLPLGITSIPRGEHWCSCHSYGSWGRMRRDPERPPRRSRGKRKEGGPRLTLKLRLWTNSPSGHTLAEGLSTLYEVLSEKFKSTVKVFSTASSFYSSFYGFPFTISERSASERVKRELRGENPTYGPYENP